MGSWNSFRNTDVYKAVVEALWKDQRGLCAYCEIDLIRSEGSGYSDIRVEHFHPKSDSHPEWTFKWSNLLLTCCGGDRSHLFQESEERFTSPDHSCDVPKANSILDGLILHPAEEVELRNAIFTYSEEGDMDVTGKCSPRVAKLAMETIDKLRLSPSSTPKKSTNSAPRLKRMRSVFLDSLQVEVSKLLDEGLTIEESMNLLACAAYPEDLNKPWIKFFSCARWYFGEAAETRLTEIGFLPSL